MSGGTTISVRVTPRADRDAIDGVDAEGRLRVRVTAPPADGAANSAVVKLIAKRVGVPRSMVSLAGGASSRTKRLHIDGVDEGQLLASWPSLALDGGARPGGR